MTQQQRTENLSTKWNFKNLTSMQSNQEFKNVFCSLDDYEDAVPVLFQELDCFNAVSGPDAYLTANKYTNPLEFVRFLLVKLVNSTWNLLHQHRNLLNAHEKLKEHSSKIENKRESLNNKVEFLKQKIERKENEISETLERERQLKLKVVNLSKDLKKEKDENIKLKKQLQSKDVQHAHEIRRFQESGNKLREQFKKTIGAPKNKAMVDLQSDFENKIRIYKSTISRLEENNGLMLQEINELRDALDTGSAHVKSSGLWEDDNH